MTSPQEALDRLRRFGFDIGAECEIERWGRESHLHALAVLLNVNGRTVRVAANNVDEAAFDLLDRDDPADSEDDDEVFIRVQEALADLLISVTVILDERGTKGTADATGWTIYDVLAGPTIGYQRTLLTTGWATAPEYQEALKQLINESTTPQGTGEIARPVADILASAARRTFDSLTTEPDTVLSQLPKPQGASPVWAARLARSFHDLAFTFQAGLCPPEPSCLGDRVALRLVLQSASEDLARITVAPDEDEAADMNSDAIEHLDHLAGNPFPEASTTRPEHWFLS